MKEVQDVMSCTLVRRHGPIGIVLIKPKKIHIWGSPLRVIFFQRNSLKWGGGFQRFVIFLQKESNDLHITLFPTPPIFWVANPWDGTLVPKRARSIKAETKNSNIRHPALRDGVSVL